LFSATTLSGCVGGHISGVYYWTAGQSMDLPSVLTFIWRVKNVKRANIAALTEITYSNWLPGKPIVSYTELACISLVGGHSYAWIDYYCRAAYCSVCEANI